MSLQNSGPTRRQVKFRDTFVTLMGGKTITGRHFRLSISRIVTRIAAQKKYNVETNVVFSLPRGASLKVPFVLTSIEDPNVRVLVDTMVMTTSGTTEYKATNRLMQLVRATEVDPRCKVAILARGGRMWTKSNVDFLTKDFAIYVPRAAGRVHTVDANQFPRFLRSIL